MHSFWSHSKALPTRLLPRVLCVHPSAPITQSPCPVCSPVRSPGLEIRRARAPATPACSRTLPCVGRLPSVFLRTTCVLSARNRCSRSVSTVLSLGEPDEKSLRPTLLPADSCRTAGIEEMGLHRSLQSVVACNRRPRVETAAFFDCGLPRGTAASSEHRGRQGIKLTTDSGSVWMQASLRVAKTRPVPLTRLPLSSPFATTC